MVDKGSGVPSFEFRDHNKGTPSRRSSPQIVKSKTPISRGGELIIRVRLPRNLTVELSDIFVLDICVRRKVHGYYTSALG